MKTGISLKQTPHVVAQDDQHLANRAAIHLLEESARSGDGRAFTAQAEVVDWSTHPPDDLVRTIDLALDLELATLAIKLAQQGSQLFPDHERIQHAARVLAPPVVRLSRTSLVRSLDGSRNWLRDHAGQYRGQWVAVCDGELLGAAGSLQELMTTIGSNRDLENTIITKVL